MSKGRVMKKICSMSELIDGRRTDVRPRTHIRPSRSRRHSIEEAPSLFDINQHYAVKTQRKENELRSSTEDVRPSKGRLL
jgi:hypothetical protein